MSFTFHDKFMAALDRIPDEADRGRLALAMAEYGTRGTVPDLPYPLDVMFECFREDIEYSRNRHSSGTKGGRRQREADGKGIEKAASQAKSDEREIASQAKSDEREIASQAKTRQDKTRQDIQDKPRPDKTRQEEKGLKQAGSSKSPPAECADGWAVYD